MLDDLYIVYSRFLFWSWGSWSIEFIIYTHYLAHTASIFFSSSIRARERKALDVVRSGKWMCLHQPLLVSFSFSYFFLLFPPYHLPLLLFSFLAPSSSHTFPIIRPPRKQTMEDWYGSLDASVPDLVSDYAGWELFGLEGDSFVLERLDDPALDFEGKVNISKQKQARRKRSWQVARWVSTPSCCIHGGEAFVEAAIHKVQLPHRLLWG